VIYSPYWPTLTASSDAVAFVVDDPDATFEVQSAATGSVTVTNLGLNADIVYTAGSTVNGRSNVDLSGTMATGTAQCRIIGFSNDPESNALGTGSLSTHVNMIVKINEHFYTQTAGE